VDVKLSLNDNRLDSLFQRETADDCIVNFVRLNYYLSLSGSPFSNGISLDDFKGGSYFQIYSLCTSGRDKNVLTVPNQRNGEF
jgi:hypothetical protein